jgi:hypothetical protein
MNSESETPVDPSADLLAPDAFASALAAAVDRARAARADVSVVVVRSADHPKAAAEHWTTLVRGLVRPPDRLGALGPREVAVLLDATSRADAAEVALLVVTHDHDDPPLLCGVAAFPESARASDALLGAARAAAAATRLEAPVAIAPPLAAT